MLEITMFLIAGRDALNQKMFIVRTHRLEISGTVSSLGSGLLARSASPRIIPCSPNDWLPSQGLSIVFASSLFWDTCIIALPCLMAQYFLFPVSEVWENNEMGPVQSFGQEEATDWPVDGLPLLR